MQYCKIYRQPLVCDWFTDMYIQTDVLDHPLTKSNGLLIAAVMCMLTSGTMLRTIALKTSPETCD